MSNRFVDQQLTLTLGQNLAFLRFAWKRGHLTCGGHLLVSGKTENAEILLISNDLSVICY
jgi:hypothetical protein